MKFPPFELRLARTRGEVLDHIAALGSDGRILAGGQSLLPLLRYRLARPHVLVDINRVTELRAMAWTPETLRIGALVRHSELEQVEPSRPGVAGLLREHARGIAFRPVRTQGTAVGSVVHADPKGDWPLAFCALDARIELVSHRGERSVPILEFITGPLETTRAVDELAAAITVPVADLRRWGRSKLQHRAGEYAACSAIALQRSTGWQCWMGAAGDKPFALPQVAALLDQGHAARSALVEATNAALVSLLPDATPVERHRHAANLADAVQRAQEQRA
jgi:CO/xanthine dehydrogenase FAD-binding subunit